MRRDRTSCDTLAKSDCPIALIVLVRRHIFKKSKPKPNPHASEETAFHGSTLESVFHGFPASYLAFAGTGGPLGERSSTQKMETLQIGEATRFYV